MYISIKESFCLDEIVKSFEVALRSFVSKSLIEKYPAEDNFRAAIQELKSKHQDRSIIFASKNKAKIEKIISELTKHYTVIRDCHASYVKKEHSYEHDAPYVSSLIDYINLLFNPCFYDKSITHNFPSIEDFHYNCSQYITIRNALSHPASTRILSSSAASVLLFITKICDNIDDEYFWFVSKSDINKKIELYFTSSSSRILKIDNLNNTVSFHKKTVCRESELEKLHEYIVGKSSYHRVAGSVVLFGYGGVGKTALVVDFIHNLLSLIKDEKDRYPYDFILFYSSKDEHLKRSATTSEIYIEKKKPQIEDFNSFKLQLIKDLKIDSFDDVAHRYKGGLVVIDNIENLPSDEKQKIYDFIKETPRCIQYIVTSRNEEPCEEKLHIKEFRDPVRGVDFISKYINSEELKLDIYHQDMLELVNASKGNALILVQCLSALHENTSTLGEILISLENIKSKSVEVIADFMYKNTFEDAISYLENQGFNPKNVLRIMSLYDENIDLYSIGKLSEIDLGTAELICHHLLKKLIINKTGENYSINEFANSFIFIKLLESRDETSKTVRLISEHKAKLSENLTSLENKSNNNKAIKAIMNDWVPRNNIDKILIAEAFEMFYKFLPFIKSKNIGNVKKLLKEYSDIELATNHPYIKFQKARIQSRCLPSFKGEERDDMMNKICRSYDDTLEAIHLTHPFIRKTTSHGAVLMCYGAFLNQETSDYSRAIRNLEEAESIFQPTMDRNYFSTLYYLILSLENKSDIPHLI